MSYQPLVCVSAVALSLGGAAIAQQQQPDWDAIQVTATEIRPGVAVLFGNGGNIGVSHGEDGTLIVDDQFAPLVPKIQAAIAGIGATPVKSSSTPTGTSIMPAATSRSARPARSSSPRRECATGLRKAAPWRATHHRLPPRSRCPSSLTIMP